MGFNISLIAVNLKQFYIRKHLHDYNIASQCFRIIKKKIELAYKFKIIDLINPFMYNKKSFILLMLINIIIDSKLIFKNDFDTSN